MKSKVSFTGAEKLPSLGIREKHGREYESYSESKKATVVPVRGRTGPREEG